MKKFLIVLTLTTHFGSILCPKPQGQVSGNESKKVNLCFVLGRDYDNARDLTMVKSGITTGDYHGSQIISCVFVIPSITVADLKDLVKTDHLAGNYNEENDHTLQLWDPKLYASQDKSNGLLRTYRNDNEPLNAHVVVKSGYMLKLLPPNKKKSVSETRKASQSNDRCLRVFYKVANTIDGIRGIRNMCSIGMTVGDVKNGISKNIKGPGVSFRNYILRLLDNNYSVVKSYTNDGELLDDLSHNTTLAYMRKSATANHIKSELEEHEHNAKPAHQIEDTNIKFSVVLKYKTDDTSHEVQEIPIRDDTTVFYLKNAYNGEATPPEFLKYGLELWGENVKETVRKHKYKSDTDRILLADLKDGDILKFIDPSETLTEVANKPSTKGQPSAKDQTSTKGQPRKLREKVKGYFMKFVGVIKKYASKTVESISRRIPPKFKKAIVKMSSK